VFGQQSTASHVVCTRFSSKTDSHLIADCSPSKCSGGGFNDGRYVKRPVYGALLTFGPDCGSTRIWHCVPIRSAKFGDRNLPVFDGRANFSYDRFWS
jgi:hypothetical protein